MFTATGELVSEFLYPTFAVSDPAISPDGRFIAIILEPRNNQQDYGVHIYSPEGQLLRIIRDSATEGRLASSVTWTVDGKLAISYTSRGVFIVEDLLAGEPRLLVNTPNYTMMNINFSPRTDQLAFRSSLDSQLYVYSSETGKVRQVTKHNGPEINDPEERITGFDWSPDERFFVATITSYLDDDCQNSTAVIIEADANAALLPDNTFRSSYTSDDIFTVQQFFSTVYISLTCTLGSVTWSE
ncbi:WD40 repeat domain-containing protein [Allohahella sp. A8]|uniref:WD40 repeat domain-containing protein n=1 Tax=Allohahella sp. A8 TaxID=3141461 RepID=UPI003A7FC42E